MQCIGVCLACTQCRFDPGHPKWNQVFSEVIPEWTVWIRLWASISVAQKQIRKKKIVNVLLAIIFPVIRYNVWHTFILPNRPRIFFIILDLTDFQSCQICHIFLLAELKTKHNTELKILTSSTDIGKIDENRLRNLNNPICLGVTYGIKFKKD